MAVISKAPFKRPERDDLNLNCCRFSRAGQEATLCAARSRTCCASRAEINSSRPSIMSRPVGWVPGSNMISSKQYERLPSSNLSPGPRDTRKLLNSSLPQELRFREVKRMMMVVAQNVNFLLSRRGAMRKASKCSVTSSFKFVILDTTQNSCSAGRCLPVTL